MIQLAEDAKCSGCMACAASCPQKAISARKDKLGNILPEIQTALCVECGQCQSVCPELNPLPVRLSKAAYAVWSLDPKNRQTSASGGAAAEFYLQAILNGYWICGAEYQDNYRVVHTVSNHVAAIGRYKQSKYVFSEISDTYNHVAQLLKQGEFVLFISLPCKVAGLLGFLGQAYDNLLTVDIVCHGTPPYQHLIEHIENINCHEQASVLTFRQDNEYAFTLNHSGRGIYRCIGKEDTYLAAFLEGLNYRESCYRCKYAAPTRISDITICDFWGLGKDLPFQHPYTGAVSAVLINSDRGQKFFDGCKNQLFVEARPVHEAVSGNAQLNAPTPMHPKRKEFLDLYQVHGFDAAVSSVLQCEITSAKKQNTKRKLREKARKLAGIFIKRYRG